MEHAYFQANAALIAATCVSTEVTRYYLNGIAVQPHPAGGVVLVSSDGHRLIAVHDALGFTSADLIVRIPAKKFAGECAAIGKRSTVARTRMVVVTYEPGGDTRNSRPDVIDQTEPGADFLLEEAAKAASPYRVAQGIGVVIDGCFPDWTRIVPEVKAPAPGMAAFNPAYLASFAQKFTVDSAGKFAEAKSAPIYRLIGESSEDPAHVLYQGPLGKRVFGVLMPHQFGEGDRALATQAPEFITALTPWGKLPEPTETPAPELSEMLS